MTDKQTDALRQAAWLKKEGASCQRHYDLGVLIERQHTELETLRAKLKVYEDLGGAADDVQLLRMGYAAARLEIESLRASHGQAPAQPAPAAVAGTSLQHIHDLLYTAQRTTGDAQAQAIAEARIALSDLMTAPEPVLATRAWPKVSGVSRDEGHPRALLVFFSAEPTDDEMRAVHGTLATAQPAPQQEAQEPVAWRELCRRLYVELFHCNQQMTGGVRPMWQQGKMVRDVLADAKAALDAAPQPSPAAQGDALSDEAVRVPLDSLHADAAYLIGRLREGSMPYARAIEIIRERIDAAKAAIRARAPADSVLEDAARYRFLRDGEWRDTDLEPFIRLQLNTLWDAKIDAARAAQEGKSHE